MSAASEFSRKWITVLEAIAGFLVAINGALLAFVWTDAKLLDSTLHWVKAFVHVASGLALISLLLAVSVAFPRIKLETKPSVEPVTLTSPG
ncbi:hypothetical protein B7G54_16605 [Burkholderia puraquae]|nr:hypothetical protein [Burkholderia puraquae]ORT85487.1 hypothetical protein B7G54_16605 [Burkholderia puraquae]